ncbi:hypothetical protein ACH4PU_31175 [Streptomyces sp. NPDC021100]
MPPVPQQPIRAHQAMKDPGPDELKARHRMVAAIARYGWEKDMP